MAIELTVRQIFDSAEAMQQLATIPLPASVSFRITRMAEQMNEVLAGVQRTIKGRRQTLFGDSDPAKASEEKREAWEEEIEGLLDNRVEVIGEPIPIGALGSAEVTPQTLYQLSWLIVS